VDSSKCSHLLHSHSETQKRREEKRRDEEEKEYEAINELVLLWEVPQLSGKGMDTEDCVGNGV